MQEHSIAPKGATQRARVSDAFLLVLDGAVEQGLIERARADSIKHRFARGLLPLAALQAEIAKCLAESSAPARAIEAIKAAFAPGDVIEVRAIYTDGRVQAICVCPDKPVDLQKALNFIGQFIGYANLYVGCNPRCNELAGTGRAGGANDVAARRVIVLDLDDHAAPDVDPGWRRTVKMLHSLDPLMIVNTGNGTQVWLQIETVTGDKLEASTAMIRAAMSRLGADNTSDLPRVMRLPFTLNLPTETKLKRGAVPRLALPVHGDKS